MDLDNKKLPDFIAKCYTVKMSNEEEIRNVQPDARKLVVRTRDVMRKSPNYLITFYLVKFSRFSSLRDLMGDKWRYRSYPLGRFPSLSIP